MRMGHGSHTSTIRMRRARSADLNEIADLWSDCGLVPSARGFRNEMGRMLIKSPELFLVASETATGGQLICALLGSYDGRTATVSRLVTHPDHRRRGVASSLVAEFTGALAAQGAIEPLVLVLDSNPAADRFRAAIDYDHTQDIRAYRHSAARAAERRATDGDGYHA